MFLFLLTKEVKLKISAADVSRWDFIDNLNEVPKHFENQIGEFRLSENKIIIDINNKTMEAAITDGKLNLINSLWGEGEYSYFE